MHWYLLSADSRPFLRHLTLPPLSPDTYESLVLAYLGIFLFDTDHLDIADRSAIDIWPSLPCLQTRTSLTCISIPRNLFFLMHFFFLMRVPRCNLGQFHRSPGEYFFLMQINFYFDTYGDIFFDAFLFFLILHPPNHPSRFFYLNSSLHTFHTSLVNIYIYNYIYILYIYDIYIYIYTLYIYRYIYIVYIYIHMVVYIHSFHPKINCK